MLVLRLHQLMRAWELKHRTITSQCVTEHTKFREKLDGQVTITESFKT